MDYLQPRDDLFEPLSKCKNKCKPVIICCVTHANKSQYFLQAERRLLELESNFIETFEIFIKFLTDFYNFIMCKVEYDTPTFPSADLLKKLKHFK